MIRFHCLQHVPFERPGLIEGWLASEGGKMTFTRFFKQDHFPALDSFDLLLVLGGPMNIYQHRDYPWLAEEKAFIQKAVRHQKKVFGICLGAQLIADVLGGKVFQNSKKEIGWFPVSFSPFRFGGRILQLPESQPVFHWHGDTFSLPPGAVRFASSHACENQAFAFGDRVIALQFHLEMGMPNIEDILTHCSDELISDPNIQSAAEIRSMAGDHVHRARMTLETLLETLCAV